ncbi:MAG: nucleoside-diphosphate-sugar epimerase [Myxococcota bacterium]|jgi:nucleoside-diphosphate-sugar epimerase
MRALVTGGAGFLGGAIVRRLLARGDSVRSVSRALHPEIESLGAQTVCGDVADADAMRRAAEGCDVVFHVAARVGGWGPHAAYRRINVDGTVNVIEACQSQGVARLVYTSTPSVVHTGVDIEGGDESLPYARHFDSPYAETKAEAERMVIAANGPKLATVALRPHLIWGPGDNQLVPRLLDRARAGRLRLVGGGKKRVDATYIDNAAAAHLLAADRLAPDAPCAGRAYFIAQDEPAPASELINGVLAAAGLPAETRSIPASVAWCAGASAEALFWALRRKEEPPLTRFAATQLATAHWYDLTAARRDLGYEPSVSTAEGLERLRQHFASDTVMTPNLTDAARA